MRSGWMLCALSLGVALMPGCFTDQPTSTDDDDDNSTTADSSTSESTTTTTATPTSTSAASTSSTTGSTTSDVTSTSMGSSSGSGTTGGGPRCACDLSDWYCVDFEGDEIPSEWSPGVATGNEPELISFADAACGDSVLETSVPQDGVFSVVIYQQLGRVEAAQFRVRFLAWVDPSCTDLPDVTRVASIQLLIPPDDVEYFGELWIGSGGGEIRGQAPMGGTVGQPFDLTEPEERWLDVEMRIDVSSGNGAQTELFIDGDREEELSSTLPVDTSLTDLSLNMTLGMFRSGSPFPGPCTMYFDRISVSAVP